MLLEDIDRYGVAQAIRGRLQLQNRDEKEKALIESVAVPAVYCITTDVPPHTACEALLGFRSASSPKRDDVKGT